MASTPKNGRRTRTTRSSVRYIEALSRTLITIGGVGTILAVTLIFLFLVSVVLPLLRGASVAQPEEQALALPDANVSGAGELLAGEYGLLTSLVRDDGSVEVYRIATGELVARRALFAERAPTARFVSLDGSSGAFGFEDGSVRLVRFRYDLAYVEPRKLPSELAGLPAGETALWDGALLEHTPEGPFRRHEFAASVEDELPTQGGVAIRALARTGAAQSLALATLDEAGGVRLYLSREKTNLLTGETSVARQAFAIPYEQPADRGTADWLVLSSLGDNILLAWRDGLALRIDVRAPAAPAVVERVDLADGPAELTALRYMIGGATLVSGDSSGRVRAWFCIKHQEARTKDGAHLVLAHELETRGVAVTCLAPSQRTRLIAAGYADGRVLLFHVTSQQTLAHSELGNGQPIELLRIAPKDDALMALAGPLLARAELEAEHFEANAAALFTKVWYEGAEHPAHVWQSSSGTDDFEPKLGLVPLIFGSLKATFYTMLFGAPLALMAAIFTSEFLSARLRAPIKSTIEMMASLPSVVLGFLAAIIVAPLVQPVVPGVIALFTTLPFVLLLGAHVWQTLSRGLQPGVDARTRAARFALIWIAVCMLCAPLADVLTSGAWTWPSAAAAALLLVLPFWRLTQGLSMPPHPGWRLAFIALLLPAALRVTITAVGPWVERALFGGDLHHWLSDKQQSPFGGWVLLTLPLAALTVFVAQGRLCNRPLARRSAPWTRARSSVALLAKFALATGLTVLAALCFAWLLSSLGLDPRGERNPQGIQWEPLGTYVQRNTLIVGFIMGFAVIPIIYTIAEDALSSVPGHLRLASLSAGATQWQTAMRVIVPTAMSGLFSALMIGLGRAVGETMIVLMATGNTPVLEANVFNGFRTLSANIAVELPEAVRNSTHYRTLFLAALVLFAMTFVVNTLAEVVRQHFRKRAYDL